MQRTFFYSFLKILESTFRGHENTLLTSDLLFIYCSNSQMFILLILFIQITLDIFCCTFFTFFTYTLRDLGTTIRAGLISIRTEV